MKGIEYDRNITLGRASPYKRLIALLLCIFFGCLGAHRFYVGRNHSGYLYMATGGLYGIGWFIDFWVVLSGEFKDNKGYSLTQWLGAPPITPTPVYQQRNHRRLDDPIYTNETVHQYSNNQPQTANKNTKYCQVCGSVNEVTTIYCTSCGAVI